MNLPTPPSYDGTDDSWNSLHLWASRNNLIWNQVNRISHQRQIGELEALRLLAARLLAQNIDLSNAAIEKSMRSATPSFTIPANELNPLPEWLRPLLVCTTCGRKSYGGNEKGMRCDMITPDGHRCAGVLA